MRVEKNQTNKAKSKTPPQIIMTSILKKSHPTDKHKSLTSKMQQDIV